MSDYQKRRIEEPQIIEVDLTSPDIPDEEWTHQATEDAQISSYERGFENG